MGNRSKIADKLRSFMVGRSGIDLYGRFLSAVGIVSVIFSLLMSSLGLTSLTAFFTGLCLAALIWMYWRALSRNLAKREEENRRYMAVREAVLRWLQLQRDRIRQRRDYAFYRCPGCRSIARVPRGKGRIRVTCRRCGYTFERRT